MPRRVLLYLYSTANIVGSSLALLGLLLFFGGVIREWWPLIVIGLYLIGYRVVPKHADLHLDASLAQQDAFRAAEKLVEQAMAQLSEPAADALDKVWGLLQELLPRLDRFDPNDKIVFDIKQTATRHLPDLIEPYLSLPPAFARFHPLKNGRTARELFIKQLNDLEAALKEALADALNDDVDRLRVQSAFLEKTFARQGDWLA